MCNTLGIWRRLGLSFCCHWNWETADMYAGHNYNRKLRPTSKEKKRNEVMGRVQNALVYVVEGPRER